MRRRRHVDYAARHRDHADRHRQRRRAADGRAVQVTWAQTAGPAAAAIAAPAQLPTGSRSRRPAPTPSSSPRADGASSSSDTVVVTVNERAEPAPDGHGRRRQVDSAAGHTGRPRRQPPLTMACRAGSSLQVSWSRPAARAWSPSPTRERRGHDGDAARSRHLRIPADGERRHGRSFGRHVGHGAGRAEHGADGGRRAPTASCACPRSPPRCRRPRTTTGCQRAARSPTRGRRRQDRRRPDCVALRRPRRASRFPRRRAPTVPGAGARRRFSATDSVSVVLQAALPTNTPAVVTARRRPGRSRCPRGRA